VNIEHTGNGNWKIGVGTSRKIANNREPWDVPTPRNGDNMISLLLLRRVARLVY